MKFHGKYNLRTSSRHFETKTNVSTTDPCINDVPSSRYQRHGNMDISRKSTGRFRWVSCAFPASCWWQTWWGSRSCRRVCSRGQGRYSRPRRYPYLRHRHPDQTHYSGCRLDLPCQLTGETASRLPSGYSPSRPSCLQTPSGLHRRHTRERERTIVTSTTFVTNVHSE